MAATAAAAAPPTEFTRGQPGDADNRGATLVEKHNERMQQERETAALEKLAALMPTVGGRLRAFALSKADWDVDAALALLRSFQVAQLDKLNAVNKKRKRINEMVEAAAEGGGAEAADGGGGGDGDGSSSSGTSSGSSSGTTSSSSSGSESSDSDADSGGSDGGGGRRSSKRRRRSKSSKRSGKDKKKGGKHHRRRSSSSKHSKKKKRRSEDKGRDKDKSRAKRGGSKGGSASGSGDDEPAAATGSGRHKTHTSDFGKFGVIREADADRKRSEFMAWALDVKKVDVEALARFEERDLFKEFIEEFNTGSLPHRKYYDLAAYEAARRKEAAAAAAAKAAAKAGTRKAAEASDEQELHRRRVEERRREQEKRVKEAMDALRKGGMAEEMRRQELLRAEMALAYKTGDNAKAQRLMERLAPDDPAKKR